MRCDAMRCDAMKILVAPMRTSASSESQISLIQALSSSFRCVPNTVAKQLSGFSQLANLLAANYLLGGSTRRVLVRSMAVEDDGEAACEACAGAGARPVLSPLATRGILCAQMFATPNATISSINSINGVDMEAGAKK
eukprot:scaffold7768_cov277-Pinguiococcus_pyrenoidosus.AAC.3